MAVDRTRAIVVVVLVAAVGGLAGWWTSRSWSPSGPATTVTTAPRATTSSAAGASTTPTTAGRAAGDTGSGLFFFRSPSDNIACLIDDGSARCDITAHAWEAPPKPEECDLDWGEAVQVSANGAGFICHGDTVRQAGASVLPYGGVIDRGDVRCTSAPTGMTCTHRPSGHAFHLARESFDLS